MGPESFMSEQQVGDLIDQRINVGLALIDWDQSEKSYYLFKCDLGS